MLIRKLSFQIKNFKPPLVPCCILAVVFSAAALIAVTTDIGSTFPPAVLYGVYSCAGIFLFLTVWAVVPFCRRVSPKRKLMELAQGSTLTARMANDFSFRTLTFTYASFALNIAFALAKGVAGWVSASWWLISLSAYYFVLCISKFLLLRNSRKLGQVKDQTLRVAQEWKAYRICGILFLLMTLVLLGVVVLIVLEGNQFIYYGILIFVVAMYDFYCLISAIVQMIRTRKQHTPTIVAIKTIGFATALVSMLSLQTAMFASFGADTGDDFKRWMNFIVGTVVCVLLCFMGIFMILQANKKIKTIKETEGSL